MAKTQRSVIYLNRKYKKATERLFWLVHYACMNNFEIVDIYFNVKKMLNYLESHKNVENVFISSDRYNYKMITKLIKLNKQIYVLNDSNVCKIIHSDNG